MSFSMTMESKFTIYTDGSSRGNPGPGGWAAIVVHGQKVIEIGGREQKTTNNRMEMTAAVRALQAIERVEQSETEININTDSAYLLNGITKWVYTWQRNGWKKKGKEPARHGFAEGESGGEVLNKDLWQELMEETAKREVEWKLVEGHSGHKYNDRCDQIATSFADNKKIKLFSGTLDQYEKEILPNVRTIPKKGGQAYSYVSEVGGKIEVHKTWEECKNRVQGKKARFRKSFSAEDEAKIIEEFKRAKPK